MLKTALKINYNFQNDMFFNAGSKFNQTGEINEEIVNMIKDEMNVISEHNIDLDFTTKWCLSYL